MDRVNDPFTGGTHTTEEDVNKIKDAICYNDTFVMVHGMTRFPNHEALPLVDRMWQEIQDLRSILTKQIY